MLFRSREFCEKWGADLLRLWVAAQDYHADVRMSDRVINQLAEAYRKIRNTFRFALGNLADFDPARDALPDAQLDEMDRWMLSRTAILIRQCLGWYEEFEFHRVFHAVHDFAVVDLSAFYFDILKDRLYTSAARSPARRSAQTAIYRIASALGCLVAPIMVFTAEEVWKYLPRRAGEPESVHMALFPTAEELDTRLDATKIANWNQLLLVRGEVLKALEAGRNSKLISSSLEAKVVLTGNLRRPPWPLPEQITTDPVALLQGYAVWLPTLFIVSQVKITTGHAPEAFRSELLPGLEINVQRAEGRKCERCWNYSTRVGESADYPTVCERCLAALEEIERSAAAS